MSEKPFKPVGVKEIDDVSLALDRLLRSPRYAELDARYAVSYDLIQIGLEQQIRRDIAERIRVGRLNETWWIHEGAQSFPDRVYMVFEDQSWTYKQMEQITDQVADWFLQQGVRKGDAVNIIMTNTPAFVFCLFGIHKIGAVAATIDFHLRDRNIEHVCNIMPPVGMCVDAELLDIIIPVFEKSPAKPRFMMVWNADGPLPSKPYIHNLSLAKLPPPKRQISLPVHVEPLDVATLVYTSGTTGLNKAWSVTAVRVATVGIMMRTKYEFGPNDRTALPTPLYHQSAVGGGVTSALASGSSIQVIRKFSASQFWQQLKAGGATRVVWVGEIARYLLSMPPSPKDRDHKVTDFIGLGLRPDVWVQFKERFGVRNIAEWYGQVEGPILWTVFQKRMLDGAEPNAGMVGKHGPIGQSVNRWRIFKFDGDTGKAWKDPKTGQYEEVEPGGIGEIGAVLDAYRPITGEYVGNPQATASKQIPDPLGPGSGLFWMYGDLIEQGTDWGLRFKDRTGDTFKYRGVNVATTLVESTLLTIKGVKDVSSYGVEVPSVMGRVGMVTMEVDSDFDWDTFAKGVNDKLHTPARPVFVRITQQQVKVSGVYKLMKVQQQKEGYDLKLVGSDKIYWLQEGKYHPFGPKEYEKLQQAKAKL